MPNSNSPSDVASQPKSTGRRDTLESVERLLDGAEATFVERGYHAANVHEICARADAWTMTTLSREMAIHDRVGLPDLDTLAQLFERLMFAKRGTDYGNAE